MTISYLRTFTLVFLTALSGVANVVARPYVPVPAPANARIAATRIHVRPDRPDWTYRIGEKVTFTVEVRWDEQPLEGVTVRYTVGPDMLPGESRTAVVPRDGLRIDGGTMQQPGFLRCVVNAEVGGKNYRALATAGFAPEEIKPTQVQPEDFDAFWKQGLEELAEVPLEPRLELIPEASRGSINVYHVSFRNWSVTRGSYQGRLYGILCEPKAPGKYPAILSVPGAGVRAYAGDRAMAEQGAITLQIGIHGIPVTHPSELYDQMRTGALDGYWAYNLENRDRYYYRRVYLGCVRANDFLTSRENWDGKNLLVMGGSQGGQLTIVTAALDPRVTGAAALYPAYSDVTGYLHGRAGGWPHMFRREEDGHRTQDKIATTGYYDTVNFARRLRVPIYVAFGYNDETCPPTSLYAAYNVIPSRKELLLALEMTHASIPEVSDRVRDWAAQQVGIAGPN